jgi:hypothetical protein
MLHKIHISGKNVAYLIYTAGSKCGCLMHDVFRRNSASVLPEDGLA